jgi:hypothetical protein
MNQWRNKLRLKNINTFKIWGSQAVVMKSSISWDITPCSTMKLNCRFAGTCRLHLQDRKTSQSRKQHEPGWHWFLQSLLFYLEDGGDMFLWNVGWFWVYYTALYTRIQKLSYKYMFVIFYHILIWVVSIPSLYLDVPRFRSRHVCLTHVSCQHVLRIWQTVLNEEYCPESWSVLLVVNTYNYNQQNAS